jgi:hypothetical protein
MRKAPGSAEVVPNTPGPWFDRDGSGLVRAEAMVTPPPSEESDEDDDEPLSPIIAHSILLKLLRGLSTEGASNNPLVSRRGSAGNVSLDGLKEFLRTLQTQPPDPEDEEEDDRLKSSPSMADLQAALADLLDSDKFHEKHPMQ